MVRASETWSCIMGKVQAGVFENLPKYFGPRGMRMGSGEDSIVNNFIVCTVHLI